MSAAANFTENLALKWLLTTDSATRPSTWYIGLHKSPVSEAATDALLEAGTLTNEVSASGTAYGRKAVSFSVTDDTATNSATVTFDAATAGWGTITHVAIMDASTSGNVLFWGRVTTAKNIEQGDTFQISSSNLSITLA